MTSKIISHRSKIWQTYDECVKQQKELANYSGQFSASNISQDIPLLTSTETPPDELAASVWQLKQEAEKIKQAKNKIEQYQSDILATKKQFFIVVGVAILAAISMLFMLF
jgi:outer membrane protein TolC